jgi:hypothetical protein
MALKKRAGTIDNLRSIRAFFKVYDRSDLQLAGFKVSKLPFSLGNTWHICCLIF